MKEYFVEFRIGATIKLTDDFEENELQEKIDEAERELRINSYDEYVVFDNNHKIIDL